MALIDLKPRLMQGIFQGYLSPEHLRPPIEAHPRLASFIEDFEELVGELDGFLSRKGRVEAKRSALRVQRDALVDRHDALVRQIWFTLQSAQADDDQALAGRAARAQAILLPEGRAFIGAGRSRGWPRPEARRSMARRSVPCSPRSLVRAGASSRFTRSTWR